MHSDSTEVICGSKEDVYKFVQWVNSYEGDRPSIHSSSQRPDIVSSYCSQGDVAAHTMLESYLKENDGSFAYASQPSVGSSIAFTYVEGQSGIVLDARSACNTEFEGFGHVDIESKNMMDVLREFSQLNLRDVDKMNGDLGAFLYDKLPQMRQSVDTSMVDDGFDEYDVSEYSC